MEGVYGRSVVDYVNPGEARSGHRCGYCKSSDGRINNGMSATRLTCQDYQDLIERGWRRSGTYVYKPRMKRICCPSYAIRCESDQFQISKSQKKVLKRMTKYLLADGSDGERESRDHSTKSTSASVQTAPSVAQPTNDSGTGFEWEKQEKTKKTLKEPKSLEDLIFSREPTPRKLTVRLVASDATDPEFAAVFKEEHRVYQKYQMHVHQDTPRHCNEHQFQCFLVDSPLIRCKAKEGLSLVLGSYHQQYWIDGHLVAVGVIDILPNYVSSVYFFYDPEYESLSLGVYSALREIAFTRQLSRQYPEMKYYCMGFYIHTCPKMKYKGQYHPSYLLCPETYHWVPIKDCIPKLDVSKYARLAGGACGIPVKTEELPHVLVLVYSTVMTYKEFECKYGTRHRRLVKEFLELAGQKVTKSMLLSLY